jgi:hypothetical protein
MHFVFVVLKLYLISTLCLSLTILRFIITVPIAMFQLGKTIVSEDILDKVLFVIYQPVKELVV